MTLQAAIDRLIELRAHFAGETKLQLRIERRGREAELLSLDMISPLITRAEEEKLIGLCFEEKRKK